MRAVDSSSRPSWTNKRDKWGGPTVKDVSDVGEQDGDLNANEQLGVIAVPQRKKLVTITVPPMQAPRVGIYEDEDDDDDEAIFLHDYDNDDDEFHLPKSESEDGTSTTTSAEAVVLNDEFLWDGSLTVDFESDDYEDPEFDQDWQKQEASRLIGLVKGMRIATSSNDSSSGAASKSSTPASLDKRP
jgi:hypothetical protein